MRRAHKVACLAGDGLGPELMAQATRTLRKVARMHGFAIEDVHAPYGSEALTRSGHPLPPATRTAVLEADAVLVAAVGEPALGGVASELDLRARITHVLFCHGDVTLLSPFGAETESWTVERAFELARRRRSRLVSVDHDARWDSLVDEAGSRHDTVTVEHMSLAETLRVLAFAPERLDMVVTTGVVATAIDELAGSGERDDRLVAAGRLAGNGPSVFAPAQAAPRDDAGQGVADPSSMLLAASLMLREGLGQSHAADTLSAALRGARVSRSDSVSAVHRTLSASTRDLADVVVGLLPASHRNAEFVPSGVGSTEPPRSAGVGFAGAGAGEALA
jgi:3-isopropylmalate dehydrogenase